MLNIDAVVETKGAEQLCCSRNEYRKCAGIGYEAFNIWVIMETGVLESCVAFIETRYIMHLCCYGDEEY